MEKNLIGEWEKRGFIESVSHKEVREKLETPLKAYIGFDPTADSLHLGNLVGMIALGWLQRYGHIPVVILGGATGKVGDPSGKSVERPLLSQEVLESNVKAIEGQFKRVLDFDAPNTPLVLNNDTWLSQFAFLDFLRDVGKHFRMGPMLAKESVKTRLNSEEGISFTEFTYQVLQGYDFLHLNKEYDVSLQMGGSDQWGNITSGIELTRKLERKTVFGITFPLLTRSDGKKFGKSEDGAIWLSKTRTSPYQFYQYLFRIPDSDVIKMLKVLTFLELEEIHRMEKAMQESNYRPNTVQAVLAEEVTRLVHGEEGVQVAKRVTAVLAPGSKATLDVEVLDALVHDLPHVEKNSEQIIGKKFTEVATISTLCTSNGEASRLIKNGGAYLNNQKVDQTDYVIADSDVIGNRYILLGSGKKKKVLVKID